MSNMSYCRFENTLNDLRDCYEHLHNDLSDSETIARDELYELCAKICDERLDVQ